MAITQTQILNLCVSMFNAAPGATNLASIQGWLNANPTATMADLGNALAVNAEFTNLYTGDVATKAAAMAANFGLAAGTTGGDLAIAYFTEALNNGATAQQCLVNANNYLTTTDAATLATNGLTDAKTVLDNKTTVSEYYSVTVGLSGATFADIQAVVANVDETAASVTAANAATDAAAEFSVTASTSTTNEGDTVTFSIANGDANTAYTYTITGVDAADVTGGNLTGTVTTNSAGVATFDISTVADLATEGTETMSVAINGETVNITVNDSSVAPAGDTFTLTSSRDIFTSLTANSDTVTGTFGTFNATDIILDSSTTDSDTLTAVVDGSGTGVAATIANVETVSLDMRAGGEVDATNFSGVDTLSIDSNYGETSVSANNLTSGMTVAVDSTTTVLTLDMYLAAGGTSSHTDAITASFGGGVTATLDKDDAGEDVDALTIHSTGDSVNTITLSDADDYINTATTSPDTVAITGDQDVIIKMDQASGADGWDGATVTTSMTDGATSTFQIITNLHSSELDLDSVQVDKIQLNAVTLGAAGDIKHMNNAVIEQSLANAIDHNTAITNATAGGTVTFNAKASDDLNVAEVLNFVNSGTVNIGNTTTTAVTLANAMTTTYAGVGNSTDVNVAIGEGISLLSLNAAGGSTLDAVTVTGTGDKAFTTTGASASNSLSVNTQGTVTLEQWTAKNSVSITTTEEVDLQEILGTVDGQTTLTVDAGKTVALDDNLGANGGITLGATSITAGTTLTLTAADADIDTKSTLVLDAGTALDTADTAVINAVGNITVTAGTSADIDGDVTSSTGNVSVTAGTSVILDGTTTSDLVSTLGNVSVTAGTTFRSDANALITAAQNVNITAASMTLGSTVTGTAGTVTLTGSSTTVDSIITDITGTSIVFAGSGHDYTDNNAATTLTGNVTVNEGVDLTLANAGSSITGTLTVGASATVDVDQVDGNVIASSATKAITIDSTGTAVSSIVTGSGNDSITTGDIEAVINTGAGNDTIDASAVTTTTNQLQINGGAGVDTITAGRATDDILTGGTGTDTFNFSISTYSGANEKITDFEVGTAGDILSLTGATIFTAGALTSDGVTVVKVDTTDAVTTANDDTDIYVMTGKSFADADAMIAGMNDATTGITGAAAGDFVIVVWSDTDGHSYVTAVEDDNAGSWDNSTEETIVQLSGLSYTDLDGLTAANFTIA